MQHMKSKLASCDKASSNTLVACLVNLKVHVMIIRIEIRDFVSDLVRAWAE